MICLNEFNFQTQFIFLSSFSIPVTVANRLKRIQREFLLEGLGEERKFHLVKWGVVCFPVRMGALD